MTRIFLRFCAALVLSAFLYADDHPPPNVAAKPSAKTETSAPVNWIGLAKQSLAFIGVEHGVRILKEGDVRSEAFGLGSSYTRSVRNLHGWADGDAFITNYVGHPMQGSVAGYIWTNNDPAYAGVEIGRNSRYWKSRLRATAFSFAYSEQFEIGPLSEAVVGHAQRDFPQQGFVDHVVTPVIGLGWMVAEDTVDRYLLRRFEQRYRNPYARIVMRGMLNPSRSMSNLVAGRLPWHRSDRAGVSEAYLEYRKPAERAESRPKPDVTTMEFTTLTQFQHFGSHGCAGGGGEASFRVSPEFQIVLDVGGCKMLGLRENVSGDALAFRVGPRWTPSPRWRPSPRWSPYAQLQVGGTKFTQEELFPAEKEKALAGVPADADQTVFYKLHSDYTRSEETTGFSLAASSGIDLKVNRALAVRVASFEYSHNWVKRLGGIDYQNAVQFTSGVVLRLGTW